jgi:hypothetical protein
MLYDTLAHCPSGPNADLKHKVEDLEAQCSDLKATHWAAGRWKDAVHDQLSQKKELEIQKSWIEEEEYA